MIVKGEFCFRKNSLAVTYLAVCSKRKKSDDDSMGEDSDNDLCIIDVIPKTKETSTSVSISSVRDNTSNEFRKRLRKRPGRKKHVEKVTRKTRSGRIYAYRL